MQSWAGEMRAEDARLDPLPLQRRHLHRLSASSANLPPLAVLPPPISMGVPPPANIDMDVDFDAEIKPHLCTCLVRSRISPSMASLDTPLLASQIFTRLGFQPPEKM